MGSCPFPRPIYDREQTEKKAVLYARHRWICGLRMAGPIPSSALHDLQFEVEILVFWCVNGVTAISQQLISGCLKGMLATSQSNPAVPAVPLWRRPLWRRSSSRSDTALTGSSWLSDCPKIRVDRLVNGLLSRFMFRDFNGGMWHILLETNFFVESRSLHGMFTLEPPLLLFDEEVHDGSPHFGTAGHREPLWDENPYLNLCSRHWVPCDELTAPESQVKFH